MLVLEALAISENSNKSGSWNSKMVNVLYQHVSKYAQYSACTDEVDFLEKSNLSQVESNSQM